MGSAFLWKRQPGPRALPLTGPRYAADRWLRRAACEGSVASDWCSRLPRSLCSWLAAAMVALASACSSVNPDIGDMTRAYSDAIERHEMNQILRNLLRAADGLPMRFQAMPTVIGTGSLEGSAGLSGRVLGGFLDGATGNPSLKSTRGFNFNLASLDNERFTSAFVGDLSIDTLNVFSSNNYLRELLFTLAFQSISVRGDDGVDRKVDNEINSSESFDRFQTALADFMSAGLRTESYFRLIPVGVDLTREELLSRYLGSRLTLEANVRTVRIDTPNGPMYRLVRRERAVRFCMSPDEYLQRTGVRLNRWLACRPPGISLSSEAVRPLQDDDSRSSIHLNIRSPRDVYKYIGQAVKAQLGPASWVPSLRLDAGASGRPAGTYPLVVLRRGMPAEGEAVLAVAEYQGQTYYVPQADSGLSAQVFEALSLLLSSSMVKDAIPASPGILLR